MPSRALLRCVVAIPLLPPPLWEGLDTEFQGCDFPSRLSIFPAELILFPNLFSFLFVDTTPSFPPYVRSKSVPAAFFVLRDLRGKIRGALETSEFLPIFLWRLIQLYPAFKQHYEMTPLSSSPRTDKCSTRSFCPRAFVQQQCLIHIFFLGFRPKNKNARVRSFLLCRSLSGPSRAQAVGLSHYLSSSSFPRAKSARNCRRILLPLLFAPAWRANLSFSLSLFQKELENGEFMLSLFILTPFPDDP